MPFLTINGQTFPVAQAEEEDATLRESGRLSTGAWYDSPVGDAKFKYMIQSAPMDAQEVRAFASVLRGEGYHWGGESDYSDKGLAVADATSGASPAKFGAGSFIVGGTTLFAQTDLAGADWTLSLWVLDTGVWYHRVQTSAGDKYEDGVAGAYPWSYTIAAGVIVLPSGAQVDDVVALPCVLPASWIAAWDTAAAYPERPNVAVAGDIGSGTFNAAGTVKITTPREFRAHGRQRLSFVLEGV